MTVDNFANVPATLTSVTSSVTAFGFKVRPTAEEIVCTLALGTRVLTEISLRAYKKVCGEQELSNRTANSTEIVYKIK